ncbi:MAG TPA: flavodoxin family protein, partial [Anaerolineaceae bacterium]|nr:flavodoxin family protein [Anaerolineaceae bacterium]
TKTGVLFLKNAIIETTGLALGSMAIGGCSSTRTKSKNTHQNRNIQENQNIDSSLSSTPGIQGARMNVVLPPVKSLLILVSYHHKNTKKIADVCARVLDAQIKAPQQINIEGLQEYDLIGFGSGIYDQRHHKYILDLADKLPQAASRKAFIFSTSGVSRKFALKHSIDDPHMVLREKLRSKGCVIVDEFNCAGWDTNSFLKLIGGINRGKPNAEDLMNAKEFATNLMQNMRAQ